MQFFRRRPCRLTSLQAAGKACSNPCSRSRGARGPGWTAPGSRSSNWPRLIWRDQRMDAPQRVCNCQDLPPLSVWRRLWQLCVPEGAEDAGSSPAVPGCNAAHVQLHDRAHARLMQSFLGRPCRPYTAASSWEGLQHFLAHPQGAGSGARSEAWRPPRGASVERHQLTAVEGQLQCSRTRVLVGRWTAAWAVGVAATPQHFYGHWCWATCGPNCSWLCAAQGWW